MHYHEKLRPHLYFIILLVLVYLAGKVSESNCLVIMSETKKYEVLSVL